MPINSIEDVRAMMREFVLLVGAEQTIEHFGKLGITHRSNRANSPEGNSALIVDHWNDGTNNTPNADLGESESHGLWVRHGTGKFEDEVFFSTPPRVMFRGTTTAKWADGSPPTVAVTELDEGLGALSVRLADTTTQDPNIRSGETITFGKAKDGLYYAFDSHLDGKIGDVKLWCGLAANIPPGWRILDSGGSYNMSGRVAIGTQTAGYAIGTTSGAATHTHTFTSDAGGDHAHGGVTGGATPATDSQGAHTHTTPTTGAGGDHSHTGSTGSTSPGTDSQLSGATYTDYATASLTLGSASTNLTVSSHTPMTDVFTVGGATSVVLGSSSWTHTVNETAHSHTLTEPNSGTGHRHALTGASHSHTVNSHTHSISASGTHTHTGGLTDSQGAHTHTVANHTHVVDTSGTHTHTGTTATGSSYQPSMTMAYIERYE